MGFWCPRELAVFKGKAPHFMQCFGLLFLNILFHIIYCCRFFLLSLSQAIKHIAVTQTLIKRRRITSLQACVGSTDGLHGGLWLCQHGANREPRQWGARLWPHSPQLGPGFDQPVINPKAGEGALLLSQQDFKEGMCEFIVSKSHGGLCLSGMVVSTWGACPDPRLCTNTFWPHVQTLDLHNTKKSDART